MYTVERFCQWEQKIDHLRVRISKVKVIDLLIFDLFFGLNLIKLILNYSKIIDYGY